MTKELSEAEAVQVAAFGLDKPEDANYVPPMGKGQRVVATAANELVPEGTLGTITWTHPSPEMPYRVQWDGHELKPGDFFMGMSDIGWLALPHELEAFNPKESRS